MNTVDRCRECGDRKPLNRHGTCRWRAGCEHRQMVHDTTVARLLTAMQADELRRRIRPYGWQLEVLEQHDREWDHYYRPICEHLRGGLTFPFPVDLGEIIIGTWDPIEGWTDLPEP